MTVDLQPLRRSLESLCHVKPDLGDTARSWPGWFEWSPPTRLDDGARTFPHCVYGPEMKALWAAFAAAGWEERPIDWMGWLTTCRADPYSERMIGIMDVDRLSALLVAIRREERFCEGHWAACLKDRTFEWIILRWIANVTYEEAVTPSRATSVRD